MDHTCKYCKLEFDKENYTQYRIHVSQCKENPNVKIGRIKQIQTVLRKNPRKEYKFICVKCQVEYTLILSLGQFNSGRYSKHCSRRCANGHTLTDKQRMAISRSLKKYHREHSIEKEEVKQICSICGSEYYTKNKFCSSQCVNNYLSKLMSERLSNATNRLNYGRYKRSYMESSFEQWLLNNNITDFEVEKQFRNKKLNKSYYADFTFDRLKLIIELDGTQHKKTIKQDFERDSYISAEYGYKIIRISYSEYKSKCREIEILNLLK